MENAHATVATAQAHDEQHTFDKKLIWKTFRVLLYITLFELALAIGYYEIKFENPMLVKHILNGIFIILTLAKAFFIVAEFMHLRHEIKNLVMTIIVPLLLFIWFITAFLWDGDSYKNLRNNYDSYHKEQNTKPAPKTEHQGEDAVKPGEKE